VTNIYHFFLQDGGKNSLGIDMERNYAAVTLRIVALAFALAASVAERLLLSMTTFISSRMAA